MTALHMTRCKNIWKIQDHELKSIIWKTLFSKWSACVETAVKGLCKACNALARSIVCACESTLEWPPILFFIVDEQYTSNSGGNGYSAPPPPYPATDQNQQQFNKVSTQSNVPVSSGEGIRHDQGSFCAGSVALGTELSSHLGRGSD